MRATVVVARAAGFIRLSALGVGVSARNVRALTLSFSLTLSFFPRSSLVHEKSKRARLLTARHHVRTRQRRQNQGKGEDPQQQGWAAVPRGQDPSSPEEGQLRGARRRRCTGLSRRRDGIFGGRGARAGWKRRQGQQKDQDNPTSFTIGNSE